MTTKKVSKRGRPEMDDSEKRSVIVQFRVTPDDREQLERAASKNGSSLSDWLREQTVKAAKRA